jgi:hypothetical protein
MNKPSRRAVVRTGVWAVPAVAAASAAPAFAGTGNGCTEIVCIDAVGSACKLPGHSTDLEFGYRMVLTFHNISGSDAAIVITSFDINGKDTTDFTPSSFNVPDGDSNRVFIVQSSTSSQRTATVCYTINGSPEETCTSVTFPKFDPCKCKQNDADPTDPNADCG